MIYITTHEYLCDRELRCLDLICSSKGNHVALWEGFTSSWGFSVQSCINLTKTFFITIKESIASLFTQDSHFRTDDILVNIYITKYGEKARYIYKL